MAIDFFLLSGKQNAFFFSHADISILQAIYFLLMSLTFTFQIQRLIHALKVARTNKKSNKEVILRFCSSRFFLISNNGCVASLVVFLVASGVILPHWYVILSLLSIEVVTGSFAIIVWT